LELSEAVTVPSGLIEPTHPGRKSKGGIVVKSDNPTELKIVTWNIAALTSANAGDHAEDQFVEWLRKENGKNNIMEKIVEIRLQNFDLSPCDDCCGELRKVLNEIRYTQKANPKLRMAEIYWQKLYKRSENFPGHHSATQTTWNGIRTLTSGEGWTTHAPSDAFPLSTEGQIPIDIFKRWTFITKKSTRATVKPVKP
jgi:hypothetical protein